MSKAFLLVGSTRVDTAEHVIVADRGGPRM